MLPCARSCVGKKVNKLPAAYLDSASSEPLLFLYPKWFRDTAISVHRTGRAQKRGLSSTKRRHNHATLALVGENERNNQPSNTETESLRTSTAENGQGTALPSPRSNILSNPPSEPISTSWMTQGWRPFNHNRDEVPEQEAAEDTNLRSPDLRIRKHGTYPHDVRRVDGLILARLLASKTALDPEDLGVVKYEAPFLVWLTGTSEENIWMHQDGSGCIIHVNPSLHKDDQQRRIFLIGTERGREIANQHLRRCHTRYQKENKEERRAIHLSNYSEKVEHSHYVHIDQVPRPDTWTLRSFSEYVGKLVTAGAPRGVERIMYPKSSTFGKSLAEALIDLFEDPHLQHFQSSFALRQALEFCSNRTDIAFAATRIWFAARQAGIIPDITCFNHEIHRCLKVGNGNGAKSLINELQRTHIQPNSSTWACFFSVLRNKKDQTLFLQLPTVRGLRYDQTSKDIMIQALVRTSPKPSDDNPQWLPQLRKTVVAAFGDKWLTPPVLKAIIEECTEAESFDTVSRVLNIAVKYEVNANAESYKALLDAVIKTGSFKDVLLLLKLQPLTHESWLKGKQIELTFREAWRQRLTNVCRVLWFYAASHGSIQHGMVTKISRSITQNMHEVKGSRIRTTARIAAAAIGTDRLGAASEAASNGNGQDEAIKNALLSLLQWTNNGEARHDQLQKAHILIERDLTAWQRFKPMDRATMLGLLDKALALDTMQQHSVAITQIPIIDFLDKVIPVNLQRLESQTDTRQLDRSFVDNFSTLQTTTSGVDAKMSSEQNERASMVVGKADNSHSTSAESDTCYLNLQSVANTSYVDKAVGGSIAFIAPPLSVPFIDLLLRHLGLA